MLSPRHRTRSGAAVAAAAVVLLTGCSSRGGDKAEDRRSEAPAPSAEQPAAAPNIPAVGISPGGVTTRMDEPAQSTEEQYAQACMAAKEWLTAKGGDPHDQVEPLLREVQTAADSTPVTFRTTWAELSNAQQAAVIIAVNAAADGGC